MPLDLLPALASPDQSMRVTFASFGKCGLRVCALLFPLKRQPSLSNAACIFWILIWMMLRLVTHKWPARLPVAGLPQQAGRH